MAAVIIEADSSCDKLHTYKLEEQEGIRKMSIRWQADKVRCLLHCLCFLKALYGTVKSTHRFNYHNGYSWFSVQMNIVQVTSFYWGKDELFLVGL